MTASSGSIRRFGRALLFASIALSIAAPTSARDWPETGGWTIFEVSSGCAMLQEYEGKGDTELLVSLHPNRDVIVIASNANWSTKEGDRFELDWLLNGRSYSGNAFASNGRDGRGGFGSKFGPDFLIDLAAADGLRIRRGDTLVDNLDLAGTAAAIPVVRRCLAAKVADDAAVYRREHAFDHIPTDPFAGPD